ncbi:MepB family protein, partial [Staphylococcus argensis]
IFPKHVLFHKGILRHHESKGKMAFRVYPTWEKDLNRVAQKTQAWQKQYFIDMSQTIDVPSIKRAYFNED